MGDTRTRGALAAIVPYRVSVGRVDTRCVRSIDDLPSG